MIPCCPESYARPPGSGGTIGGGCRQTIRADPRGIQCKKDVRFTWHDSYKLYLAAKEALVCRHLARPEHNEIGPVKKPRHEPRLSNPFSNCHPEPTAAT